MAGHSRIQFVPDLLYAYNYAASFDANATDEERAEEKVFDARVRGMPKLQRLDNL